MASPVDTSVKYAYSAMNGAPVINGTAGSLISALDAFLVSGWGIKNVDSGVISGGVCRLSFSTGKSAAEPQAVILVSGATPAGLNGEQKVTAVSATWVEFKTALPDGPVTGPVTFKMAPLGWEKVFSGTNVAVYRPTDLASTRMFYRVDDTNALYARVVMYENMTDVDTGVGLSPPAAGGYYWHKSTAANALGIYWLLIGDSRAFYYVKSATATASTAATAAYGMSSVFAGDINSYKNSDAWCGVLSGAPDTNGSQIAGCWFATIGSPSVSVARAVSGLGGRVALERRALSATNTTVSGQDGVLGTFPAPADNSLRLTEILAFDTGPRGQVPGALFCPQTGVVNSFGGAVRLIAGTHQLAGRQLLSVSIGVANNSWANQGIGFFDITGPWRD